ncbi:MAG: hypothetical protein ACYDGO_06620 [Smithellaceae bacterium]
MKTAFIVGYGLLPFWLALPMHGHWAFFYLPCCIVPMSIALITVFIYNITQGDESNKFKRAALVFTVLFTLEALALVIPLLKEQNQKKIIITERQSVSRFVARNGEVIQKVSGIKDTYFDFACGESENNPNVLYEMITCRKALKQLPNRYVITINSFSGHGVAYAVVDVSRKEGVAHYALAELLTPTEISSPWWRNSICAKR